MSFDSIISPQLNHLINIAVIKATIHTPLGDIAFEGTVKELGLEVYNQHMIFGNCAISYDILDT